MKFKNKLISIFVLLIFCINLSGCTTIDKIEVKLGIKNQDFEYIKQGKINKIVIQNTRDQGFKFTVTDPSAISELYDILSSAKPVEKKSSLQPDYIFEMDEGADKVYKFNYIAGLDPKNGGNLYSDNKTYIVSNRLDSDIIKSLWNINLPKNFSDVYYNSIIKVLQEYLKNTKGNKKIGINLNLDIDALKYILSVDLNEFQSNLSSEVPSAELVSNNKNYDVTATVVTQGYKRGVSKEAYKTLTGKTADDSTRDSMYTYKMIVTLTDNSDKSETDYYVWDINVENSWQFYISTKKFSNY